LPNVPEFLESDIRYQGFENKEGQGRGIVTLPKRKVDTFKEVDVAICCILAFYLGNGIQEGSGHAYKWCPFWGIHGQTSAKITSITRSCDHYAKQRVAIFCGSQVRGLEEWTVTNPKQILIRHMLQLLQQRTNSGSVLAMLRMPQFPGRAHLPPDVLDASLMPILREMARDYLIAPAVTSDTETEDSVAYLKRSFATSLDAEVNNNTFNWEEIT
jgi:hypothetical protein